MIFWRNQRAACRPNQQQIRKFVDIFDFLFFVFGINLPIFVVFALQHQIPDKSIVLEKSYIKEILKNLFFDFWHNIFKILIENH